MTTFLLIRHASHDWLPRGIAGRMEGVHLNDQGRIEAQALAMNLRSLPIDAIYASPLERTRETALFLATELHRRLAIDPAFLEIDFGRWTGCEFPELENQREWRQWNRHRELARVPEGESMREAQARALDGLGELALRHKDEVVAVISHGDVIRAILLQAMGRSLDDIHELEIDPASVSVLRWENGPEEILQVNVSGWKSGIDLEQNPGGEDTDSNEATTLVPK